MNFYVGQRLSLKDQLCTVRYIGPVGSKPGEWLGVEWDNPDRGKHNGSHEDVTYFTCRSKSSTAGSFLKPQQTWDPTRTFLQAIREKYMSNNVGARPAAVFFSSKEAEEIGFDKFAQRQSQLQGIHVLVLTHMRINADRINDDKEAILETCAHITDLDLGDNLFESVQDVIRLCSLLPKLRRLILDGNRFDVSKPTSGNYGGSIHGVKTLSLSSTFLTWSELCFIMPVFPSTTNLTFASNAVTHIEQRQTIAKLESLDLSGNHVSAFSSIKGLRDYSCLQTLVLKHNLLEQSSFDLSRTSEGLQISSTIINLDLAFNRVSAWTIINSIPDTFPSVRHIRLTGNPIFKELRSADGNLLTSEDGHMLTIARLSQLESLNYSKITAKERLNAETYYLGQIATELFLGGAEKRDEVLSQHPRWRALCEEYGEPADTRETAQEDVDPNSLVARLLTVSFTLSNEMLVDHSQRTWKDRIPKSISIYTLLSIVGKQLDVMPLSLRFVWETGESDPVGLNCGYSGPEWWDSSDDESENNTGYTLVSREIELVAGTRTIGSYIEGREAQIRVELKEP